MVIEWRETDSVRCVYPGEVLIRHGLLSSAPEDPSWAISLHTLELFLCQRQYKPNFASQNFIQVLCRKVSRPYYSNMTTKFNEAFDLYLLILRSVDRRVAETLGRDDSLYEIRNFCPCCTNAIPGEPNLKYNLHYSLDGSNSFKRFKDSGTASRPFKFSSPYIIERDTIDKWKHVIKRTEKKKQKKGGR